MKTKTSIRFFNNIPIRSRWDDKENVWWYSATDIVASLTGTNNARRYWNTFKSRHHELSSLCRQLKLTANDGKQYLSDALDENGVLELLNLIKCNNKLVFSKWIKGLSNPLDELSRQKAYELFENNLLDNISVGTTDGLCQIHKYLFDGIYDFAGQIRTKNISKSGFQFANALYLSDTLNQISKMDESTLEDIVNKYIEMNIAHPFMEGNGRATRIWLDLILKSRLNKCVDWSLIDKKDYLYAMEKSPLNPSLIYNLINKTLTNEINNREIFMKGIDYSYYYEEVE